jgi:hypothetical protein
MVSIKKVDERRAGNAAKELGGDEEWYVAGDKDTLLEFAGGSESDGDGRIEVGTTDVRYAPDGYEDGHSPAERNHDPPRAVPLRLREDDVRDDTIAQ